VRKELSSVELAVLDHTDDVLEERAGFVGEVLTPSDASAERAGDQPNCSASAARSWRLRTRIGVGVGVSEDFCFLLIVL